MEEKQIIPSILGIIFHTALHVNIEYDDSIIATETEHPREHNNQEERQMIDRAHFCSRFRPVQRKKTCSFKIYLLIYRSLFIFCLSLSLIGDKQKKTY